MNLSKFYIASILPVLIIILLAFLDFNYMFVISIILYYIYRCFLDYYKLKKSGIVSKKDIWKFIIPVWTFLYFQDIYFR